MGWLEYILVTPSHHRIHHAINPEYLDKNYSQIFIFWDKLFGTFQPELKNKQPIYGTMRPAQTWNPIIINFITVINQFSNLHQFPEIDSAGIDSDSGMIIKIAIIGIKMVGIRIKLSGIKIRISGINSGFGRINSGFYQIDSGIRINFPESIYSDSGKSGIILTLIPVF